MRDGHPERLVGVEGEGYIIGVFIRFPLLILFAALQSIAVPRLEPFCLAIEAEF